MKLIFRVYIFALFLLNQAFSQDFSSHIHSTNQHINQLLFYRPYTQPVIIKSKNSFNLDISESNIFQKSENLEADFEITTVEFTYYYVYSNKMELSFNYPLYNVTAGFLDDGLNFVHETLGIATTREHDGHKNNQLNYQIDGSVDKTSSYLASGNPQIELKYSLYSTNNFYISVNSGIKIPIGKSSNGFSSEKIDIMSALQVQKIYDEVTWILNSALTFNGKYDIDSDINSERLRYFISLANQFPLTYLLPLGFLEKSDFLFNYQFSSAPYKSDDKKFGSYSNLLQFAIRTQISKNEYIDIFFNQNTIPRHNEADVTFGLSYYFKGV